MKTHTKEDIIRKGSESLTAKDGLIRLLNDRGIKENFSICYVGKEYYTSLQTKCSSCGPILHEIRNKLYDVFVQLVEEEIQKLEKEIENL